MIAAFSEVQFSSENHRTDAETTSSADETRSNVDAALSFEASAVPPHGTGVTISVFVSAILCLVFIR